MKLSLILALIFCSSFTLCDKRIVKDKDNWKIVLYPDCSDTTTYIIYKFSREEPYSEKPQSGGELKYFSNIYELSEKVYVNNKLICESGVSCRENDTSFYSSVYYRGRNPVSYYAKKINYPGKISINDSIDLYAEHYSDGTTKECTIENHHKSGPYESISWDEQHLTKWLGNYVSIEIGNDTINRVSKSDSKSMVRGLSKEIKTGYWYKYDSSNKLIDSVYYNDPKSHY